MTNENKLVRPWGLLGAVYVLRFVGWIFAILGPIGGLIIALKKVEDCSGLYCVEKDSPLLIGWGIGSGISSLGFGCLFIAVGGYLKVIVSKWNASELSETSLLVKIRKWYVLGG
jgi:hypothetical protein